ncbi:hypothetical protein N7512_002080 [Penicillium capsulatum]|nr:hypothetical protein N7512_002080 [Penicillium capsulatum]
MKLSATWVFLLSSTSILVTACPPSSSSNSESSTPASSSSRSRLARSTGANNPATPQQSSGFEQSLSGTLATTWPIPSPSNTEPAAPAAGSASSQRASSMGSNRPSITPQGSAPSPPNSQQSTAKSGSPTKSSSAGGNPSTTTQQGSRIQQSASGTRAAHSSATSVDPKYDPYAWKDLKCNVPAATDEEMDPKERWEKSGAVEAWGAGFSHWVKSGGDRTFSHDSAAHGFNSTGGYLIIRSMAALNLAYKNILGAYDEGKDKINTEEMSNIFGETTNYVTRTKKILDAIAIGWQISVAPMWNKFFRHSSRISSNDVGTIKDMTNGALTQSLTIVKDLSKTGSALAKWEHAEDILQTLHSNWTSIISTTAENMFNGSSISAGELYNHIRDGRLLVEKNPPGQRDDQNDDADDAKTAYAVFIIPEMWKFGESGPVVLDTGYNCTADKNEVPDKFIKTWLPATKTLKDYWACVDGKTYYLVAAKETMAEGCNGDDCDTVQFQELPGMEKVTDYGFDHKTIITGSLNAYKKNGNKNGYVSEDLSEDEFSYIYDLKWTSPGVFSIPVCGAAEAGENWWRHSNKSHKKGSYGSDFYPCNA